MENIILVCDYSRDYLIDYFGFKTLECSYLMKINKVTVERPILTSYEIIFYNTKNIKIQHLL